MPSLQRVSATLLHASAAYTMAWGWFALSGTGFDEWVHVQKGGHTQFLTIQGLAVAFTTMALALVNDIFPQIPFVKQTKRAFGLLSLPLAFVVSTIYWSLIIFLPDMIIPQPGVPSGAPSAVAPPPLLLPLSTDLALHAAPFLSLLLDFFVFDRKFSKSEMVRTAPAMAVAMAVWYGSWVEHCASYNGVFPYPFLTENPLPIRVFIYAGATLLAVGVLHVLNPLHPNPRQGSTRSVARPRGG
ncbi:FAR-17a/AIG1-like protein [Amylostereum chailletii]|nr:FAR-17a/AIG1-like protein [Amylostereum chailletii]